MVRSAKAASEIERWQKAPFDDKTIKEVQSFIKSASEEEIELAFGRELHFGTAGLRDKVQVGPGYLNRWTIAKATQGVAHYLKKKGKQPLKVVLGYDPRLSSVEFAKVTAAVLSGNGISVYMSEGIRPTPWVSFATRHLDASLGIMITASHNPKEDNGYKVYWTDGAQVVPPHDTGILEEVAKVTYEEIAEENSALITKIAPSVDEAFLKAVDPLSYFKIAYSPLYGAGYDLVPKALLRSGYHNLYIVQEEGKPDGHFPRYPYPNPEVDSVMGGVASLMEEQSAQLGIASDPDSDRIRAATLHKGKVKLLTGNQMAVLMVDHLLAKRGENRSSVVVTTIVSSPMIGAVAQHYHAEEKRVLTGFKYIGQSMLELENAGKIDHFCFGCEESCGFLPVLDIRDKDATSIAVLLAEIAAKAAYRGKSLWDLLLDLYQREGLYIEEQKAIVMEDSALIKQGMEKLAKEPPKEALVVKNLADADVAKKMQLPTASVLYVKMSSELSFWIRPSGTEPKVKIYAHMGPVAIVGEIESFIEVKKAEIFSEMEKIAVAYFKK